MVVSRNVQQIAIAFNDSQAGLLYCGNHLLHRNAVQRGVIRARSAFVVDQRERATGLECILHVYEEGLCSRWITVVHVVEVQVGDGEIDGICWQTQINADVLLQQLNIAQYSQTGINSRLSGTTAQSGFGVLHVDLASRANGARPRPRR